MSRIVPQIKIVMLGDTSVGKTCLLQKYVNNTFAANSVPTVGGATATKTECINGLTYNFQVWDTAGAEKYRSLTPLYVKDAAAAIIVFDLSNRQSFHNVSKWIDFALQHSKIPYIIVGNKEDLEAKVTNTEASDFANENSTNYIHASAKIGINVDVLFKQAEMDAISYWKSARTKPSDPTESKKSCC